MAKKNKYNKASPLSVGLGLAVTGATSMIPGAAPLAGPIGTMATGLFGGVDLTDEEKNIKAKFDEAINKTWDQIYDDYKLTDVCFSKLKQGVPGENTSTDEFVNNNQRKKLEDSYALVIQPILEMHRGGLEHNSKKTWDDEYIKNASEDIACRLISTLQTVLDEDDLLKILKAIADRSKDIRGDIAAGREANRLEHEQLMKILAEISELIKAKRVYSDIQPALTTIPAAVNLIGRDNDVVAIIGLLKQVNIVSIHADGGVGKTALAATIANQIKKDIASENSPYEHVAWITSTGKLKDDLTGLNIPSVVNAQSSEDKLQAASMFLQGTSTFLVIDNMDEPPTDDEIDILNTIAAKTKILITSRADIPNADEIFDLDVLDPESALVLFYRCFKRNRKLSIEQIRQQDDILSAKNIIEAAGRNALFIELIGKMAYADRMNLDSLWGKLKDNIFGQDSKYPIHTDHAKSHSINKDKLLAQIQKLYQMSSLSDKQKEIMSFITLFPPEHSIFFDVFEWAGFEDDEVDNLGNWRDADGLREAMTVI